MAGSKIALPKQLPPALPPWLSQLDALLLSAPSRSDGALLGLGRALAAGPQPWSALWALMLVAFCQFAPLLLADQKHQGVGDLAAECLASHLGAP